MEKTNKALTRIKENFFYLLLFIFTFSSPKLIRSQSIVTFDTLHLLPNSYWNGGDLSNGFWCSEVFFPNIFVDWGGGATSWGVFAYSNKTDTVTSGYLNQYSSYAGGGYDHSANYGIGYFDGTNEVCLILSEEAKGDSIAGFFVTNNTYSALSMKYGDGFSKKFGGISRNDSDWFLLSISGYRNGLPKPDSVNFYLADYRFSDSTQDYIVKDWQWVDLNPLGRVDSIKFQFSSTDNGSYGMNTPAYFCLDNLMIKHQYNMSMNEYINAVSDVLIYPNPAFDQIHLNPIAHVLKISISDISGKIIYDSDTFTPLIQINSWGKGMYFINIVTTTIILSTKFIKN